VTEEADRGLEHQHLSLAKGLLFWHRVRGKLVAENIPRDRQARVVDIGAGTGWLGEILASARPSARYMFTEALESQRQFLRARYGADAEAEASEPLRPGDAVVALDVVEHIEDDAAFLSGIVQRMEPGATIIITVPAGQWLWSRWDESLGHYRRYSKRSLRRLLQGFPLDIVEVSFLFPELVPAAIVRRFRRARSIDGTPSTEFPNLPGWLDRLLEMVASSTARVRRAMPFGTSLIAVGRRRTS
jgi:SAM-dependent methyltransferase